MPMINYNEKDYPNLYNEILKDYHFRYGKFSPIPYPMFNKLTTNLQEDSNTK